jgi:lipoate-protein ligase A
MDNAWRFIDTGERTGEWNMRFDEELARRLAVGEGASVLRLFRWKPWAISLGYNQRIEDIDAEACGRDGIDVVRRPTGGRAILHAEELTYSVVMPAGRKSVLQVYNDIGRALVRGLGFFGVDGTLQRSQPDFAREHRDPSSVPCFTSSARYEIEWKGRKLVGSAQRRFSDGDRDVVLQHGSILCGPAHQRLADYLAADEALRDRMRVSLRDKTADLAAIRGSVVQMGELAACLMRGFEKEWGIEFVNENVMSYDQQALHG